MNDPVGATLQAMKEGSLVENRPFVCLSYAQSIDGSIAARPGQPYPISSSASLAMTHKLRSIHDCLMIGVGTALIDNPQLTVRLVDGDDPDPVILDSHLRLSPQSELFMADRTVHVFCADPVDDQRAEALSAAGALIHPTPQEGPGLLALPSVLGYLYDLGYRSVMVEGGATLITNCYRQRCVDWLVITVAPLILAGLRAPFSSSDDQPLPSIRFQRRCSAMIDDDYIICGQPVWESP